MGKGDHTATRKGEDKSVTTMRVVLSDKCITLRHPPNENTSRQNNYGGNLQCQHANNNKQLEACILNRLS
eukprot:4595785-Amphidinium_carterae.1